MFAVTRQVYLMDIYSLEIIYVAIFMIGMAAAILLGRWTTKRLLVLVFIVATLISTAKAIRVLIEKAGNTYTVQAPV